MYVSCLRVRKLVVKENTLLIFYGEAVPIGRVMVSPMVRVVNASSERPRRLSSVARRSGGSRMGSSVRVNVPQCRPMVFFEWISMCTQTASSGEQCTQLMTLSDGGECQLKIAVWLFDKPSRAVGADGDGSEIKVTILVVDF